jgi:hypothetical protein
LAIEYGFREIKFSAWKGSIKLGFRGKASAPTNYNGIRMLIPGIFLVAGTFKSPETNAFPKLELLKSLLSFSRPKAPTSISVKQQFASTTPNKFIE